jgi:hypothetical protein
MGLQVTRRMHSLPVSPCGTPSRRASRGNSANLKQRQRLLALDFPARLNTSIKTKLQLHRQLAERVCHKGRCR